jgi:hypothetical protein
MGGGGRAVMTIAQEGRQVERQGWRWQGGERKVKQQGRRWHGAHRCSGSAYSSSSRQQEVLTCSRQAVKAGLKDSRL